MIEWLDDFYGDPDMRSTMLRNFLPLFTSYVTEATGGPVAPQWIAALAESYIERHLGSSRAQLQEIVRGSARGSSMIEELNNRFDEWEEKRPEKVARNELVRSANATAVEQMREAGVEKMVWQASGGACPFCQELDGTIISVTGTFFEPGDTLNPEGVEHPINFESTLGHPPVHQGCTCYVEAVTDADGVAHTEHDVSEDPSLAEAAVQRADVNNWANTQPWNATIEDVRAGKIPGIALLDDVQASSGSSLLGRADNDAIKVTPKWFTLDAPQRAQVLYHESGHYATRGVDMGDVFSAYRVEGTTRFEIPFAGPGRPPNEVFADVYADLVMGEARPDWIVDFDADKLNVFARVAKEAESIGLPIGDLWRFNGMRPGSGVVSDTLREAMNAL